MTKDQRIYQLRCKKNLKIQDFFTRTNNYQKQINNKGRS
jgi:hypothetical protein